MDTTYLGKKAEETKKTEETITQPIESDVRPQMSGAVIAEALPEDTLPLARFLGINDHPSEEENGKLAYIVNWLKTSGISERADMLARIKAEEMKLGEPHPSERRINVLYRVFRLNAEIDQKVKELMAYQKGLHNV